MLYIVNCFWIRHHGTPKRCFVLLEEVFWLFHCNLFWKIRIKFQWIIFIIKCKLVLWQASWLLHVFNCRDAKNACSSLWTNFIILLLLGNLSLLPFNWIKSSLDSNFQFNTLSYRKQWLITICNSISEKVVQINNLLLFSGFKFDNFHVFFTVGCKFL